MFFEEVKRTEGSHDEKNIAGARLQANNTSIVAGDRFEIDAQ